VRAIVTGCAGFIGSHLTERLIADGWRVTGIDAFRPYYDPAEKEANLATLASEPRFDLVRDDLVTAPLDKMLAGGAHIFHMAAQPRARFSFVDRREDYLHDNVLATHRLFDAALSAGCRRVVFASSSCVYGDSMPGHCVEDMTPVLPRSHFGVTKQTGEHLADAYRRLGLDSVGLRYFTVYGPRQRPDMDIRRFCEAAVGRSTIWMSGDLDRLRDFVHIDDAIDATMLAARAPAPDTVLNIGGGTPVSLRDVVKAIETLTGRDMVVDHMPAAVDDDRSVRADIRRARQRLMWRPKVTLAAGLHSELVWVGERRAARGMRTAELVAAVG
jgi:UDP-glucuronate 4-epimerase